MTGTNAKAKRPRAGARSDGADPKPAAERPEQSAAAPSPFPPIADYAFLSDCHTGALLAPDGSIDWLCVPRFDSPSMFGSLLDREAGLFRLGPFGVTVPSDRHYVPGTNVLSTTWKTGGGWLEVTDALIMGPTSHVDTVTPHTRPPTDEDAAHMLVRTVTCLEGEVELELICEPAFDYGREPADWVLIDDSRHTADASAAGQTVRLQTDLALGVEATRIRARHTLAAGERAYAALAWGGPVRPRDVEDAQRRIDETVRFWRHWLARARPFADHRWREAIQRSALAIKGLTYMPTGATVAALTTSLPETPGGERNWDYRYTWMRDSTFTLQALHLLGLDGEAEEFMQFVADLEPNSDGGLQIMYGIDGRRDLTETFRDDLSGYSGAHPVRIGNGAFDQRQNDVFGAVLDSILKHTMHSQRLPRRLWPIVQAQAECATSVWGQPDQGIWEARGKPQHYVSSKLMCWVAMDRAAKLASIRDDRTRQAKWQGTAEEIHADILAHGLKGGVLRQHYDTEALDASTLLAAMFGFLPGSDERMHDSVLAIANDLTENGYVLRYRTGETDDGLSGKEGTFLICSFWLVSALSIVGEAQRAHDLMERLLRVSSPLGLYAEEFDAATDRHLGNFPQAFSHLALIEAAARIILAEQLALEGLRTTELVGAEPLRPANPLRGRIMSHYDVIIIGSGAGGGTLARHLAPSGKRILVLERGGWLPREPANISASEVFAENRYVSPDTWRYPSGEEFQPQIHYYVGGATKLYGAALYRLRAEDFGELRHHDGLSPRWPIAYDEMEPYYALAEERYQVHGARGEDPTEPPASGPYPFPAVSHEPRIQKLSDDLEALGHHPFHAPCGVMLNEGNMPYSNCMRCANCDGFPCIVHAKSDAEVLGVRPALEHDNVELLIGAEAVRLTTDAAGTTVTGVVVDHEGSRDELTADFVVVSCGAANSARLLLMSANDHHPGGLANGSDQVGRNYMFHNSQAVLALSMEENPTVFQKTLGLNDFYLSGPDFAFPMGNIQMVGKSQAPMFRGEKPGETMFAPTWSLDDVAKHAVDFWLSTEDLPRPENRVTVDDQGVITIAYEATNNEAKDRLFEQLKSMLGHLGMHKHHLLPHHAYLKNEIPVAGVAHQAGTCRFGSDPKSSVLDSTCKAHELDNLYVADTSFFPSIGAVNPALTAMANALRVGDRLLERMGVSSPSARPPAGAAS